MRNLNKYGIEILLNLLKLLVHAFDLTRNIRIVTKKPKTKLPICQKEKHLILVRLKYLENSTFSAEEFSN